MVEVNLNNCENKRWSKHKTKTLEEKNKFTKHEMRTRIHFTGLQIQTQIAFLCCEAYLKKMHETKRDCNLYLL